MPLTRWNSTSGFAAPSQSTSPASRPAAPGQPGERPDEQGHAAEGEDPVGEHAADDVRAGQRRDAAAEHEEQRAVRAGVSRQIVGIVRVSGSSTPSAAAGPKEYGSSPRAVIALCAR